MELDNIRVNILNIIIEMYQNSNDYQTLLDLLNNGEDLSFFLKRSALAYVFCMTNLRLSWVNSRVIVPYTDDISRLQEEYDLYCDYAKYFLGASVLYPSMELVFEASLQDYSLVSEGRIDYSKYVSTMLKV